jgi:hypothetical protein
MTFSKQARLCAWLGATALAYPALAADRPADPAGARAIADFIADYAGKATAPSVKVVSEGSSYLVTLDLGALNATLKPTGFTYDAAELKFRVFQQDDGQWRIETASTPPISGRMTPPNGQGTLEVRVETEKLEQTTLLDPKLGWIASSRGGADKVSLIEHGTGFDEVLDFAKLRFAATTKSDAQGLTTTVSEPMESLNLVMDIDRKGADPANAAAKPVHVSAKGEGGAVDIALKGFQPGPLAEGWRFFAAHPERADYARDFAAFRTTVDALLADAFTVDESFRLDKLHIVTESGPVEIEGAAFGAGAVNGGADSGFSEHIAAKSIKLPDGMLPGVYAPLVPTSFDIGFKASGFDLAGAAQEWFANAHLEGDGPPLTKEQQDKVTARLVRSKPIVVDILPSHIVGPSLNLAFEGRVTIDNTQPVGSITIQAPNFDQMAQAIHGLGPKAEQQLVPVIAMAKGLGKPGPDGALIWVCDLGRDKVMKINGLPLGKSPF